MCYLEKCILLLLVDRLTINLVLNDTGNVHYLLMLKDKQK